MIKHVGFPKCVCGEPFTLVHSPAELRKWNEENEKKAPAPKKEKADKAGK